MVSLLTMDFPMITRASGRRMPYSSTAAARPPEIAKKRGRFIQRIAMMTRKTRQSFSIRMFILNLPYPLFSRLTQALHQQPPYPLKRTKNSCHDSHSIMTAVFPTTTFSLTGSGPGFPYKTSPCPGHVNESLRVPKNPSQSIWLFPVPGTLRLASPIWIPPILSCMWA